MKRAGLLAMLFATLLAGCSSGADAETPDDATADAAVDVDVAEAARDSAIDVRAESAVDVGREADTDVRPEVAADVGVDATKSDPSWPCASSSYLGKQYWTCAGSAIHRCEGTTPVRVDCAYGCVVGPAGTDDACNASPAPPLAMPVLEIVINGSLFAESAVRKPLEDGLRYELDRLQKHVALDGKKPPSKITLTFSPSSDTYCSGLASVASASIDCPRGYPITGDNQNYVVNISIHEMGHILAQALVAPPGARDTCTNEGIASWIAGKYWMNAASVSVPSLRAAAQHEISSGKATATMTTCISASDAWYKVYASYFEYLELFVPDGVRSVGAGLTPKSKYEPAWQAWMK
ncbi:MAG: hypothetical protein ABI175_01270 [Polyangiales bacterium]